MDIIDYLIQQDGKDFLSTLIILFGHIVVQNATNIGVITIYESIDSEYSEAHLTIN